MEQHASGPQSVQIGRVENSTLTISYHQRVRRVPLAPLALLADFERSPALMVNARSGVIPYVGREDLRASLLDWANMPGRLAVRALAGRGGTGKTRLAVEIGSALMSEGWLAGLLQGAPDNAALEELAAAPVKLFVAVDYAETRPDDVVRLLQELSAGDRAEHPARVLLLIREAPSSDADPLRSLRYGSTDLAALLSEATQETLDDARLDADTSARLYDVAIREFAARLTHDGALTDCRAPDAMAASGSPLLTTLSAYIAVTEEVAGSVDGLFDAVIARERRYWEARMRDAAITLSPERAERVVALATLATPADDAEAVRVLRYLPEFADASAERCADVAAWAGSLYPGPLRWNPLEPDLLGEHLVARTLAQDRPALEALLADAAWSVRARTIVVLGRMLPNHPQVAETAMAVLGRAVRENDNAAALVGEVLREIPNPPPVLVESVLASATTAGGWAGTAAADVVAGHEGIDAATRFDALDVMLPELLVGSPWRIKDWTPPRPSGLGWSSDPLGRRLLPLVSKHPEEAVARLVDWLGDRRPLETSDGTSRREVALAILATRLDMFEVAVPLLMARGEESLAEVAHYMAQLHPAAAIRWATTWSSSEEHGLRAAALSAVSGSERADDPPAPDVRLAVLDRLTASDWLHRDAAEQMAAPLLATDAARERALERVASGDWGIYHAERYLSTHPGEAIAAIAAIAVAADRDPSRAVLALNRFFPADPIHEKSILSLVNRIEDGCAWPAVGMFAEGAVHESNNADVCVGPERLALGRRLLLRGPEQAQRQVVYALSHRPQTEVYARFHEELAGSLDATPGHVQLRAHVVARGLRNQGEGWPTAGFVELFIDGLDDATASQVLLLGIGDAAPAIYNTDSLLELLKALTIQPSERLALACQRMADGTRPVYALFGDT